MDRKKKDAKTKPSSDCSRASPAKPPPNYMKPIGNHRARKEASVASSLQPCSCVAGEGSGQSKTRKSTLNPSSKRSPIQEKLKDVTTSRGGSASDGKKACKYSRCSLNAHGHDPVAKHPFLARRLSVRARRSFRVKGVPASAPASSSSSRRRGVWRVEKPEVGRHAPPWVGGSGSAVGGYGSAAAKSFSSSSDERRDRDSEFSVAELGIIRDFLGTVGSDRAAAASVEDESDGAVTGSTKWFLDRWNLRELALMIDASPEKETPSSVSGEEAAEWSGEATGLWEEGGEDRRWGNSNKDRGEDPSAQLGASGELIGVGERDHDTFLEASMEAESITIIDEAEEYFGLDVGSPADLEFQLEEGYFPADDIELLLEEFLSDHSEINKDEGGGAPISGEDREQPLEPEGKLEARLSMKRSLIEKCFEKLKTIRQSREPDRLPTARERELRRDELRQMAAYDERGAEEWMVDYKLRRLIEELARARKQKVALLVEAFESITPQIV